MGTGRWGGVGAEVLEPLEVPLDLKNVGRLRDDWFGFIEEGGVLLLLDKVSSVDVELPAIISPLDWHSSDELVRKLVFDRRRRSLKKGMVDTVTMPQRSHPLNRKEMNDRFEGNHDNIYKWQEVPGLIHLNVPVWSNNVLHPYPWIH